MAIGADLFIVGIAGAVAVFAILESRPFTRQVDDFIRQRARELGPEVEEAVTASDLEAHEERRNE